MPDHQKWDDDEAFLVERARHFDLNAVGQLYRLYVEDIYRYVSARVSDAASAEDITSEVFLRALESLESFEYRGIPFSGLAVPDCTGPCCRSLPQNVAAAGYGCPG